MSRNRRSDNGEIAKQEVIPHQEPAPKPTLADVDIGNMNFMSATIHQQQNLIMAYRQVIHDLQQENQVLRQAVQKVVDKFGESSIADSEEEAAEDTN